MHSSLTLRSVVLALTAVVIVAGCASTATAKTCSVEEVKKCDDQLTQCSSAAPCDDPTNPSFQGCVDSCKKQDCDCETACGNTCR